MTVTRVPLYRVIRQLSLLRAVVSCITFCVSSRYITYLYLYYVLCASPSSLKCYLRLILFGHFLFEGGDEITILLSTGCSAIPSSVHFGGVARALARRGRISLESETDRVLTV